MKEQFWKDFAASYPNDEKKLEELPALKYEVIKKLTRNEKAYQGFLVLMASYFRDAIEYGKATEGKEEQS